jgi:hypothetical protein
VSLNLRTSFEESTLYHINASIGCTFYSRVLVQKCGCDLYIDLSVLISGMLENTYTLLWCIILIKPSSTFSHTTSINRVAGIERSDANYFNGDVKEYLNNKIQSRLLKK